MKDLLELFGLFFKIGLFSFGGGYAMLPLLQQEFCEKRDWLTPEELLDFFTIGQCTPGIIAVNTATFVGYKRKGSIGGVVATIGMVIPSLIIITVIAMFLQNFADYEIVKNAFAGIKACVCAMIINAVIKLWKNSIADKIALIIYGIILIVAVFTNISAVILVLVSGVAGIVIKRIRKEAHK